MDNHLSISTSWSQLYNARKVIRKKYPSIWKLPIIKKIRGLIPSVVKEGDSVLDVGSCNRNLKIELQNCFKSISYKSMDVDKENLHDYYDMKSINEGFDVVTMFECIEHLTLEEGVETLKEIYRVLKPGGRLLLSTPNTYHPNRYWECTHKVPFRYDELGGFVELAGFKTEQIYRIYNDTFFLRIFRLYFASHIHKYFNIDFAKSILLVARK